MVVERQYWVTYSDNDDVVYIEKEIRKAAVNVEMNLQTFRAWLFKAFVYDPEIRAKVIEFIKKNG